jgi:quercetin dioxygenase-like cupin family protein
VRAFGLNAWRGARAGDEVIEPHDESDYDHEELYVVLRGRVTFDVAGETVDLPAGSVLFVSDPRAHRRGVAAEDGTLVLTVGAKPGEAFRPSAWELEQLAD